MGLLAGAFNTGGNFVLGRLALAVALADLLLDLLGDHIDGGVQVALAVLGEEVGAAHGDAHATTELSFGYAGFVTLQGYAGIHGPAVQMIEFIELFENMIFN